ncbi:proline dehydrogenase family protein [Lysinibacillus sp. KU-BSD001]|uniref:proline dehydrogenase family protein n=1 Tax=Lysinibacillus sp. KU-BSD001 TaxID=3141328 RepID=UPI0036DFFB8A
MVLRDVLMNLSKNELLNTAAQKYGLKLGAQSIVAGTNVQEMIDSVKKLNASGIEATIDRLGEFVVDETVAIKAKDEILDVIDAIHTYGLHAHISVKPSQVGLDIDIDFCYDNLREIVEYAEQYHIFVNLDMENYERLQPTLDMLKELHKIFDNVGTVIQAYLFRSKEDIEQLKDCRLRIVKGAYQESEEVAYQDKLDIDINFLELIEYHLLHGKFTSIATHDHNIIHHVKRFVADHNISNDQFEFQMLYGFRTDMQKELANHYRFCTYVPFGEDWYGYFMRRLAERPQNINLVTKQVFNKKTNTLLAVAAGAFLLGRLSKRK